MKNELSVDVQTGSSINWKKVGMVAGSVAVVAAAGYAGYRYGARKETTLAGAIDAAATAATAATAAPKA
jgi:hypothetical protein